MREADGEVSFRVRVQPRSSAERIAGVRGDVLLIKLKAPPVEGAANLALARLLARVLGVPPTQVHVVHGASGRDKLLRVPGRAPQVRAALERALEEKA